MLLSRHPDTIFLVLTLRLVAGRNFVDLPYQALLQYHARSMDNAALTLLALDHDLRAFLHS